MTVDGSIMHCANFLRIAAYYPTIALTSGTELKVHFSNTKFDVLSFVTQKFAQFLERPSLSMSKSESDGSIDNEA